ncbi:MULTISPECIES: hypothetical protein [unclassified Moraxella]|uniref:hypothetical protein n=1 Tax=unclassified Moraxella TaxID=2685852 RepID=UPI003AF612E8
MLRPIDVIFKHPVQKFTVIYQNGKLWQLPRLDFTGKSLLVKKPYKGSREHIFVANDQTLDTTDTQLIAELITVDLPSSITGRNVDEFEHWWRHNWFHFKEELAVKKQQQQQAKALLEQAHIARVSPNELNNPTVSNLVTPPTTNHMSPSQSPNNVSQPQHTVTPAIPVSTPSVPPNTANGSTDPFDDMLDDLMKDL